MHEQSCPFFVALTCFRCPATDSAIPKYMLVLICDMWAGGHALSSMPHSWTSRPRMTIQQQAASCRATSSSTYHVVIDAS